jgi:protein-arginine kinase activator protein McsA
MNKTQKEQIKRLRLEGFGYIKVAQALGLSENTVKSYCRRNNLSGNIFVSDTQPLKQNLTEKYFCKQCGNEITQILKRKPRRFCSDGCRGTFWKENQDKISRKTALKYICPVCNRGFFDYGRNGRKYCSHKCYITDRYKGGVIHE